MIKTVLTFTVACFALATAANVSGNQQPGQISVQQALQQIQNQPHVAIPNSQHNQVAGYYVTVPYDVLATLSYNTATEAHQYIQQLQQQGYLPIYNNAGILLGFYTQTTGASTSHTAQDANYYVQNLYNYGLTPIVNQQNQVVGLYYSYQSYGYGNAGIYGGLYPQYNQGYNYQQHQQQQQQNQA